MHNTGLKSETDDDDDDDDDDDGVYLKAVSCKFPNLQIIRIICKCEVMMCLQITENRKAVNMRILQ